MEITLNLDKENLDEVIVMLVALRNEKYTGSSTKLTLVKEKN